MLFLIPYFEEPLAPVLGVYAFLVFWLVFASWMAWRAVRAPWRIVVAERTVRFYGMFGVLEVLGNSFRSAGHRSLDYIGGKIYLANEYDDLRRVLDAIEERFPDVPPLRPY